MSPPTTDGFAPTEATRPLPPSRKFLLALLLLLVVASFLLVREFLAAVVLALLIGYLLYPLHCRLLPRVRWPSLSASLILLLFTLIVALPVGFVVQQLADEALLVAELARDPDGLRAAAASLLERLGVPQAASSDVVARGVERSAEFLQVGLVAALANVVHVLASLIVLYFLLFFVVRDGDKLVDVMRELTPLRPHTRDRLFQLVGDRVRAIALGTFLVSIVQGVVAGLGWWFFGFPAPFFWGFVMTVIAVLPLGAPFFVLVPAGIWALVQGDWFSGIGILVWSGIIVGLIDDVLRPYVVGRRAGVHPTVILVGTLGGLAYFGVSGFILGPLLLSMLEPVLQVWAEERRETEGGPPAS